MDGWGLPVAPLTNMVQKWWLPLPPPPKKKPFERRGKEGVVIFLSWTEEGGREGTTLPKSQIFNDLAGSGWPDRRPPKAEWRRKRGVQINFWSNLTLSKKKKKVYCAYCSVAKNCKFFHLIINSEEHYLFF